MKICLISVGGKVTGISNITKCVFACVCVTPTFLTEANIKFLFTFSENKM